MPFDGSPRLPETTAEKLRHLLSIIEPIPEDSFNMDVFFYECGTPGCIAGHAACDATFKLMGLEIGPHLRSLALPTFAGKVGLGALREFFGIGSVDCARLFGARDEGGAKRDRVRYLKDLIGAYEREEKYNAHFMLQLQSAG